VLMIGGNIPGATQTVSILIYDQVQALNYAVANQTALLLLALCFTLLLVLFALRGKRGLGLWGWQ
jgi:molybdate transport system permease protein